MINLERIKFEKFQPPLLRRSAPAPFFHPLFSNFQISPPPAEVIKIYFHPISFKKGGVRTMKAYSEPCQTSKYEF